MRVPIITVLFTLTILLNANSANSSTQPSNKPSAKQEITTTDDRPLSPRLATLRDHLKSGDRKALGDFWKEITERGAPIVEPIAGSKSDVLVTMLWRAREETRNVFVFRLGDVSKPMVRLLDTDLWYKTFQFQKGARFISTRDEPSRSKRVGRHHPVRRRAPERPAESASVR